MSLAPARQYKPKRCEGCGEEYTPTSGRQKWCEPACRDLQTDTAVAAMPAEPEPGAQVGPRLDLDPELRAAVREAVERNAQALEWAGEDRRGEDYRTAAFEFVRWTRGHPALDDLDPPTAHGAVRDALGVLLDAGGIDQQPVEVLERTVWTLALGELDCYGNVQDPEQDFLRLWETLRPKPGLAGAVRDALRWEEVGRADRFGSAWSAPVYRPRRVFLGACQALSVWSREAGSPEGVFPLAVKPLARELGWPWTTVRDWRKWAEDFGFITRIGEHGKGKAATFRLGSYFDGEPQW